MSLRQKLEIAKAARNSVPLGDWSGFCAAQAQVRSIYEQLARG